MNRVLGFVLLLISCPGSGFSQGKATALGEYEVAEQFLGFWKNFIDTFQMQGRKVYVTGESYAGVSYCYTSESISYTMQIC